MHQKVGIVIEHDNHGYYAYASDLPGCHSQAPTIELVVARVKEAIELYLESLTSEERADVVAKEVVTTTVEVRVT